ncbi:MFS transporter [Candidatus Thorarchaeota archaeon]|nr:MAG: MFS transporter [Candidatus Thorarchaeota archaeon]
MTAEAETSTGMPGPYLIVLATSFGVFLSALDSSIVNVSLVTMAADLGVDMSIIQWVVVAYLLVMTSAMPLMGKFGDRYGKTRIFQIGMVLFISGSLVCALSRGIEMLMASRVFQAIGASMMSANGLALVTYFTSDENRGRAIGMNSIVLAAALGLGPVLGGLLTQFYGWPSIFLVNLPIGILGLLVLWRLVPRTEVVEETKFDTIGAALFFTFLFLIVYYVTVAIDSNLTISLILITGTIVTFIAFIIRERDFVSPIISLEVLADRRISTGIFSAILAYMAMVPVSFLMPFYLQRALGFDQFSTGIFLVVQPLMISVTGPVAGFVSERMRARYQTVVGLMVQLGGLLVIAASVPNVPAMAIGVAVMGTGLSFFSVGNGNFIMTCAPKKYMGVISALTNVARTTGFSVATALVTTVFGLFFASFNPGGAESGPAYVLAYSLGVQATIWAFCILALLGAIVSAFRGMSPPEEARCEEEQEGIPLSFG